ncbi:UNC93-like protein MFSD11 [Aphelenchoides besseyi]|nr:UNC93-like protein MFSD11 [Aphelenchoides besseyi]
MVSNKLPIAQSSVERKNPNGIFHQTTASTIGGMNPNTFNVIQLGIGFFLIFFSFNAAASIQEIVLDSFAERSVVRKHAGYNSLAIIYAVFAIANLFSAPIIHNLGSRYSMTLGAFSYATFHAGFFFLNEPYLYLSSALVGLGAAALWNGEGAYLANNSDEETASRHSGIFWAILQSCQISGGIFLFVVFRTNSSTFDSTTMNILYGSFTAVSMIGIILLMNLRSATNGSLQYTPKMATHSTTALQKLNHVQALKSTFQLAFSKRMGLFMFVFLFSGMEESFNSTIFSTCIAFTTRLTENTHQVLAINVIVQGLGQVSGSFVFGIFKNKFSNVGRDRIIIVGTVIHVATYLAVYLCFPSEAPLRKTDEISYFEPQVSITLICGYFFGFSDACWNTQITTFLISKYSDKSVESFALFKIFQTTTTCLMFFGSMSFRLEHHMILLSSAAIIACICFILAEQFCDEPVDHTFHRSVSELKFECSCNENSLKTSIVTPTTESPSLPNIRLYI